MLAWLGNLITGPLIGALLKGWQAKLAADTDEKRIIADAAIEDIKKQISDRQAAKEIRLATAGFWEMRLMTALVAIPFVLHAGAVGLDTIFKMGWRIPAYPAPFSEWEGLILLSFFGLQATVSSVSSIAAAIRRR